MRRPRTRAQRNRHGPTEPIRVPLTCHKTGLPYVAVFLLSQRTGALWFDRVQDAGATSTADLIPPAEVLRSLPWEGVRCPHCGLGAKRY
jgi:hypothetical protein